MHTLITAHSGADGYADNTALLRDWDRIMRCRPKRILYAHWPEERVSG